MNKFLIFRLVLKAKLISFIVKALGKGQATSLPGISIEKRYTYILKDLTEDFNKIILISGTNGKTTTRAILTHIFEANGEKVCSNKGGANLIRGIASSLLSGSNLIGKPKNKIAIFEVEEASLPKLTQFIRPDKLILTNIFRDQLDAYGEITKTQSYFRESLENIQKNPKADFELILNQEDGMLTDLASEFEVNKTYFCLDDETEMKYEKKTEKKKPKNTIVAKNIVQQNLNLDFEVSYNKEILKIHSQLSGVYNVYNILAAVAATYPIYQEKTALTVSSFKPVFGRGEIIELNKKQKLTLFLIKNPAGFDQVLNLLEKNFEEEEINLAININDKIADGKDVSWLWDVNMEDFVAKQKLGKIFTGGTRGLDMLLRLEFAGCDVQTKNYVSEFKLLLEKIKATKKDFIVLCTYTALLEFRKLLESETTISKISDTGN